MRLFAVFAIFLLSGCSAFVWGDDAKVYLEPAFGLGCQEACDEDVCRAAADVYEEGSWKLTTSSCDDPSAEICLCEQEQE
jgi:hypothetical protein